jgi:hypothetical protein
MVHPSGEKRWYQFDTLRSKYGGKVRIPECQKANMDLDPGSGGPVQELCEFKKALEGIAVCSSCVIDDVPGMVG